MRQRAGHLALVLLAAAVALGSAVPAAAQPLPPDVADRPAATLLLPNFQVDLNNPNGVTTLFTINNASASAVLAKVTVWSDLAIPLLAFEVYLTGFDVVSIDMRDLLNGVIPQTADAGADQGDTISPHGPVSQDINFSPSTTGTPRPCGPIPLSMSPADVANLRAGLTGQFHPVAGGCCGLFFGDNKARGYVTVDSVLQCSPLVPTSPGYFSAVADNFRNILWGDYFQINPSQGVGRSNNLVHIRAEPPGTFVPGDYTFYGRYVGFDASDRRQPLSTNFMARYRNGPPTFTGGTVLSVWRDPKFPNAAPFTCGTAPPWFPLGVEQIAAFDTAEDVVEVSGPSPFPAATQRVQVGGPALPVPFAFGQIFLNLNTPVAGQTPGLTDPAAAQAWVEVSTTGTGVFSGGNNAMPLDTARQASHLNIPVPP